MTNIQLIEAFEFEIGLVDNNLEKPTTTESQHWLNLAISKFVTTRLTGTNVKMKSFEQDQKRIDDLRTLIKQAEFSLSPTTGEYSIELPLDYLHAVGETVWIYSNDDCWPTESDIPIKKRTDVLEATVENFDRQFNNTLSEHRLNHNNARPLRLFQSNEVLLITDGNYYIDKYLLTYLKIPTTVDAMNSPFEEYTDLAKHTHTEIVKMAALMFLENRSSQRYTTFTNMVNEME